MDSLSKKDESKLGAFTSLLESFGGLDLDEPPEVEDKEILKVSVKKTEKPKEISEVKVVDEVKVDDLPSEPQLKLSNKDQEKLSSFAGLMESFGALLDEPPQLEDEKVFEMKVEDVYPEENKEKIEEKKKIETSKLMAFEKLFTEFTKEQEKIDEEVLNIKITDIYPEKPKVVKTQEKVEKPKVVERNSQPTVKTQVIPMGVSSGLKYNGVNFVKGDNYFETNIGKKLLASKVKEPVNDLTHQVLLFLLGQEFVSCRVIATYIFEKFDNDIDIKVRAEIYKAKNNDFIEEKTVTPKNIEYRITKKGENYIERIIK